MHHALQGFVVTESNLSAEASIHMEAYMDCKLWGDAYVCYAPWIEQDEVADLYSDLELDLECGVPI